MATCYASADEIKRIETWVLICGSPTSVYNLVSFHFSHRKQKYKIIGEQRHALLICTQTNCKKKTHTKNIKIENWKTENKMSHR